MKIVVPCVLVLILGLTGSAEAQFCAGRPSFRDGPMQVGLGAAFTEGARGVGATFALGGDSFFAGAGVTVLNYTDLDTRATDVSAFVGADLQADDGARVFLCPAAQADFGVGPDLGPIDISSASIRGGGNVGVIASEQSGLMVIPTFGLFAIYTNVTADLGMAEESSSDSSGVAHLGVGFVFNRNVGITPSISIPFSAIGGSDVVFTLQFSFNFDQ